MAEFACLSFLCKQFILLTLSCWIWSVRGENKSSVTGSTTSSANSGHMVVPAGLSAGSPPSPSLSGKNNGNNSNHAPEEEDFPTWIAVIVSVVVGFIIVSCCICAVRIRRWRKDQGRYSIWNEHGRQPNVESLYARESGVLFEQLDLDSSLAEDKCYEIPVDSFITPQRVYINGIRVTPVNEGLEDSLKSNERRMSESAQRIAAVNENEYCAVTDRISCTSDVTGRNESTTNSVCGDASKHSSVSSPTNTPADHGFPAAVESPVKETYCKPLPVIGIDEAVTCETYNLSKPNQDRVSALLNRPLPRTPMLSALAPGSSVSLDRSLLRQQHEENLQRPNTTFRTLPRPKKLRQLHFPLVGAMVRSSSSSDVTGKEARLSDHVASDTNDCTLTRMEKRLSQSLDTLVAAQRTSHFYENPYLMLSDDELPVSAVVMGDHEGSEGHGVTLGDPVAPQYASVHSCIGSQEDLPRDKEHLYARISTYMDTPEGNPNRHSYASVHYSGGKLPSPILRRSSSRHTYVSVIFGSAESLSKSAQAPRDKPARCTHRKSRSCSDLASLRPPPVPAGGLRSTPENEPAIKRGVNVAAVSENFEEFPRVQFSRPHSSVAFVTSDETDRSDGMDGIPNGGFRESSSLSPDFSSPSGCYQNVIEALNLGPSFVQSPTRDCSASTPCNGSNEVVRRIPNGTEDDRVLSPSVGTKSRYENVNEALDSSSVGPVHDSARGPSSGTRGVVHHHIPNGLKAGGRYENVNEALDSSSVGAVHDSARSPSSGARGVVHHHIPNGLKAGGRYENVNEALETNSVVTPVHDDSGHTKYNGTSTAVHGVPNGDGQERGPNREHSMHETNIDYANLKETLDASFLETLPKDSTSSSSTGPPSAAHHAYENIATVLGDSSYLADNSGSELEDSFVFSEPNSAAFRSTTISTRNSESSNQLNDSYYGVPKTSVRPPESYNGNLDGPFSSDDGGTIAIYEKCNRVAANSLDDERRPKTLSTYLEGRLGKGQEVREETGNLGIETKVGNVDEDEHTYENFISNKRQSCGSDISSSSRDRLSSTSSQLSIDEKESENQPLIRSGRSSGRRGVDSDVNGNSVCDRFVEKLELQRNSGDVPGNHLSEESVA